MPVDRQPSPRLLREISALADGSLPADRRAALEARLAAEPGLAAILADQRRAVAAVRTALPPAPPALRERIQTMRTESARRPARRSFLLPAGGGALAAATAAAVIVLLTGGAASSPSIADAAALTVRPATAPAPASNERTPVLEANVGGVSFPDWAATFGWRAVGRRTDKIDGRHTVTVFYAKGGRRIGYTIVDGTALPWPDKAAQTVRNGTDVRSFGLSGRTVVTWRRDGHSCVMSGDRGVSRAQLVALAAWRDGGSLIY